MKQVIFRNPDAAQKGYSLLLQIGTVVYTGKKGEYIVPEESIEALKKEKVAFEIQQIKRVESVSK